MPTLTEEELHDVAMAKKSQLVDLTGGPGMRLKLFLYLGLWD